MNLLGPADYLRLTPLLLPSPYFIAPRAVLKGVYPGAVFADNPEEPSLALVWVANQRGYLIGSPQGERSLDFLGLIYGYMFPLLSTGENGTQLELAAPNNRRWLHFLDGALARFAPRVRYKLVYKFNHANWQKNRFKIPNLGDNLICYPEERPLEADALTSPRDQRWVNSFSLHTILQPRDQNSPRCEASGIISDGDFLVKEQRCNPCLLVNHCAEQVGDALLQILVQRNLTPWWATREDNLPGQQTGGLLGFSKVVCSYPVYTLNNE
jgi:hypothetical protein